MGADAQGRAQQELGEHAREKRVHENRAPEVGGRMLPAVTKAKSETLYEANAVKSENQSKLRPAG